MTIVGDLAYPPADFPAWRPNGADVILSWALGQVQGSLATMIARQPSIAADFAAIGENPAAWSEADRVRAGMIQDEVDRLDLRLGCAAYTAMLMAAIDSETWTNMVCFYRLGEVAAQAAESLPPVSKIELIHRMLGRSPFSGTHEHQALVRLYQWRNSFAHGKNVDRPKRSLRVNHLVFPLRTDTPADEVRNLLGYLDDYLLVQRHLGALSPFEMKNSGLTMGYPFLVEAIEAIRQVTFAEGRPATAPFGSKAQP